MRKIWHRTPSCQPIRICITLMVKMKKRGSAELQPINVWINLKRAGRNVIPTEDTYLNEVQCSKPSPEEYVLETDVKQELYNLCSQLKPPYQEIALDYFYYEKGIAEIVEQSGKKTKTIQTQVYRTKVMLRKLWRRE